MLFMVIERFKDRDPIPVYRRVRDPGIKFPEGLTYVGSWIEPNFDRCFQLMECDDLRLLQQWVLENNRDLGMSSRSCRWCRARRRARSSRRISTRHSVSGALRCPQLGKYIFRLCARNPQIALRYPHETNL